MAGAVYRQRATSPRARTRFLAELAKTGIVTQACEAAQVRRDTVYELRNRDPEFAAAWEDALEQAGDGLEQEAYRRAVLGWDEEVYTNAGYQGTVHKYDSSLLALMLKAARPEKYRDNVHVTAPTSLGIAIVLEQMRSDRSVREAAADFVGLVDASREDEI